MSNNINSFAENMNALVRTSNNQLEILDALQRSLVNNSTTAYVNLKDPYTGEMTSYAIPALQGVVNRLSATENAIKNLLTGTGTVSLADGTSRSIQITPLAKIPENIYNVNNPTTFNIDSNWFFEDLMFPGITVRVNLQGQVDNDSDRVRVKRVIIDSRVAENQTVWYNNLANTSLNYLDLISLLNNSGIEYSEDEETLQFPLTNRSYQGQFVIQGSDIINNRIWYTFDTFDYYEITRNGTGNSTSKTLAVGDLLSYNNTILRIENINYSENKVLFKFEVGVEQPGINSYLEFYEEPFKTKELDIRVGIHEYNIIYFKGINEAFNLLSASWGYPMTFYTDDLINEDGISLATYYANNIVDWGSQMIAEAKNKTITAFEGVTPDAPVLSSENFSVVKINTQINAALDLTEFKNIVADIDNTKSDINSLRNTIASQKSDLQNISNLVEYKNVQEQINVNTLELTQAQNSYRSLLSQAQDLIKENGSVITSPKYHIRGFFPIPEPKRNISTSGIKTTQQVIGFEIQYRYIKEDETGVDLKSYTYLDTDGISQVTGIYTDWNITATAKLEKAYNEATGAYEWVNESIADGTKININQVDIPISKGEKVEFRIRSISEAGWPGNPLKSEWSNSVIIEFPSNLSTASEAENLIESINNENGTATVDNVLNSLGVYTHLNDSIPNINSVNGMYYKHQADYISYELTTDGDGINKTIETISVQDAIDRLINNKTVNTYTKTEIDNKFTQYSSVFVKTTKSANGVPIPQYNPETKEIICDKIYLIEKRGTIGSTDTSVVGFEAWILDMEKLDLNNDGKVNVSDITVAINNYIKGEGDVTKIISIRDFILGLTTIKDFWKPLLGLNTEITVHTNSSGGNESGNNGSSSSGNNSGDTGTGSQNSDITWDNGDNGGNGEDSGNSEPQHNDNENEDYSELTDAVNNLTLRLNALESALYNAYGYSDGLSIASNTYTGTAISENPTLNPYIRDGISTGGRILYGAGISASAGVHGEFDGSTQTEFNKDKAELEIEDNLNPSTSNTNNMEETSGSEAYNSLSEKINTLTSRINALESALYNGYGN